MYVCKHKHKVTICLQRSVSATCIVYCEWFLFGIVRVVCSTGDHMCDEEEIVIQTTVNELEESDETSNMFSSRIDPNAHLRYGSLRDKIGAVEDMKCIVGAGNLKELIGNHCRQPACNMKIRCMEVKATCGYAMKLEWLCEAMHRGIWYSYPIYAPGFAVKPPSSSLG